MDKRLYVGILLAAAAMGPSLAFAGENPWERGIGQAQAIRDANQITTPTLSMDSTGLTTDAPASQTSSADGMQVPPVLTLDAGGVASRLHGFGDFRIATAYITPRGLVVVNEGVQFQPLVGLVLDVYQGTGPINDISLIAGAWSDFTSHHPGGGGDADIWDECDFFGSVDVKFLDKFDLTSTIAAWTFPTVGGTAENNPHTEYNADFKFSYDDTSLLKDFAVHPYIDIFWNFAGQSSPVVSQALLGQNDHTFYAEIGIAPSYTFKAINDFPITFTLPAYFSVGDSSFWGETPSPNGNRSNLGVASVGLKASVPLKFIPSDFGNWSAYIGVTYIHTCNPALSYVNTNVLSNGDTHEHVIGYAGVGFGF